MINTYKAWFINIKTGETKILVYESIKPFIEAWEEAISYFNTELLKLDKTWMYYKVERI